MILSLFVLITLSYASIIDAWNTMLGTNRFTATDFDGEGCPGTPAQQYTAIQIQAHVNAPCYIVINEMKARIKGTQIGTWEDPHNNGIYHEVSHPDQHPETEIYVDHLTGDRKYVDSVKFTFLETNGRSKCDLAGCSMSQVESANDASTNFCNMYNLICSQKQGCTTIGMPVIIGTIKSIPRNGGSTHSVANCKRGVDRPLPTPPTALTRDVFTGEGCPKTAAQKYTASKILVIAGATCARVSDEILARAYGNGAGRWMDPHNNGSYIVWEKLKGNVLQTQHHTGNHLYYDLQMFSLNDIDKNKCEILACSMSQGTSNNDASTNYCNMRNLLCGSAESCVPVKHDFSYNETKFIPRTKNSGHDVTKCDTRKLFHFE